MTLFSPRLFCYCVVIGTVVIIPQMVLGAVVINEVAWMGYAGDANNEWVEIHNRGAEAVTVDGWVIEAADGTPVIYLIGSVPADGYHLYERTDDTSVPGQPADGIYTGAMQNTGETLRLKDVSGAVMDTVTGGEDWSNIGGDSSGMTPQRQLSDAWVTADPTPRAVNAAAGSGGGNGGGNNGGGSDNSGNAGNGRSAASTEDVGIVIETRGVTAGQPVTFNCGTKNRATRCVWNFGDGSDGVGRKITHTFALPGVYQIYLRAGDNRDLTEELVSQLTVLEPQLQILSLHSFGDTLVIKVQNEQSALMNLAGLKVTAGDLKTTIPEHTVIGPKAVVGLSFPMPNKLPATARIETAHGVRVATYPAPFTSRAVTAELTPVSSVKVADVAAAPITSSVSTSTATVPTVEPSPLKMVNLAQTNDDLLRQALESLENHPSSATVVTSETGEILYWVGSAIALVVLLGGAVWFRRLQDEAIMAELDEENEEKISSDEIRY